ncbi:MAG: aldo/keto reductase [Spirochaetales bacterium]|nr:aldo/keto reductase [Spirochaetales bacterium]
MQTRRLGKTGFMVHEIGLGTWQVGGVWGQPFDHNLAERILDEAIDRGVNFLDTADVYSDGESEKAVGRVIRKAQGKVLVATKCGRRIQPHVSAGYTPEVLEQYVDDSLRRLGVETIDLIQLHCPPTEVFYRPEIFDLFDRLKAKGKIRNLGVSVEKVEEAMKAVEYDNVTTVQIIFNMLRQRPSDRFFALAREKDVGILARVPLASGLLTGKFSTKSTFGADDHRNFNRQGAAFDKGETFAGVDYETGLRVVEKLKAVFPAQPSLAAWALRWILRHPEVSLVIPGASRPEQVVSNLAASELRPLTDAEMVAVREIYNSDVRPLVHQLW